MKLFAIITGIFTMCSLSYAADYVSIGNPGNTADTTGYGAVAYAYQISKTEVSVTEFKATGVGDGLQNYWERGDRKGGVSAPAVYVSLWEAMQYCNYLTTGNKNVGVYTFTNGVYVSTLSREQIMSGALNSVALIPSAIYALPTESEWYKAAYFKMTGGYSGYANGTDTLPAWGGPVDKGGVGITAGSNYKNAIGMPTYIWAVTSGAVEQNGTFNMMGNVAEWTETTSGLVRGGAYATAVVTSGSDGLTDLHKAHRQINYRPNQKLNMLGFRTVKLTP